MKHPLLTTFSLAACVTSLGLTSSFGVLTMVSHTDVAGHCDTLSVPDVVDELGEQIGSLSFVTHCYRRPRALPQWPYNLFAMVHGDSRDEVLTKRDRIADLLGDACRASDILFSTRILKKTGMRLRGKKG